jgi:CheY-like chemotaxis protein
VIQPARLDLNEVVTNLAKMLQRILGEDVHLRIELHSRPLWIFADAGMVEQVLMNLSVNARDAMPGGGLLTVTTAERMVDGRASERNPHARAGQYCCVSVSDTGCGIPDDILGKIFEPFFTTKEPGKGTGLGLSTAYGIAQQHDGWVDVVSEVGRGTTFEVFLPMNDTAVEEARPAPGVGKPRGAGQSILLVEDDEDMRRVTRSILVRYGYRVIEACHGHDAIAAFERCGGEIDLLLTDMVLPKGMHGREVALVIRARRPGLRVVFISGYSPELAAGMLALGPGEAFVPKPFQSEELLTAIRQCLVGK